jgi:hypothetical protein
MVGIMLGQVFSNPSGGSGAITLSDVSVAGVDRAGFKLDADGNAYELQANFGGFFQIFQWITPLTGMDQYDVRATLVGGDPPPVGTFAAWLNLGADRTWGFVSAQPPFDKESEISIEIRRVSDGVVVASSTVTLTVPGS